MKRVVAWLILCLVLSPGFANSEKAPVDTAVIRANAKFGFKLFSELINQDADRNVSISPMGVAMALELTYSGASGKTKDAMTKVLELNGINIQELNLANSALLDIFVHPDLAIANSLWLKRGIGLNPEFVRQAQKFYRAKIAELDFSKPETPGTINKWVKDKTNGNIREIVDTIPHDAFLYLVNAVYFKRAWKFRFDEKETRECPFILSDGTKKKIPMMSQSGNYQYYRGNKFQAVSLPYRDTRMSMFIFLPDTSLEEFYKELNPDNWQNWVAGFYPMQGSLVLPRFKLKSEVELNDALKALGMEIVFDKDIADFQKMLAAPVEGPGPYISTVKHKTFVEVNEQGTEAVAATSEELMVEALPFSMTVDRPFFFAIRDNGTGTILFMGSVVHPE